MSDINKESQCSQSGKYSISLMLLVPLLRRVLVGQRLEAQGSQTWELHGARPSVVLWSKAGLIYSRSCTFGRGTVMSHIFEFRQPSPRALICFVGCWLQPAGCQNSTNMARDEAGRDETCHGPDSLWLLPTHLGWQDIASNCHHVFSELTQILCGRVFVRT